MEIFSEINAEGTAVMIVTHDAKVAALTERIMFMRDGKIASELKLLNLRELILMTGLKK